MAAPPCGAFAPTASILRLPTLTACAWDVRAGNLAGPVGWPLYKGQCLSRDAE